MFYALFIVLCRPAAGKLMDRYGENVIMYPCIVIYVIAFVTLSHASSDWMVFLSGSLVGIGYGSLISTAQTICVKYAPKHRVALATSAYFISMDTGIVLGPMLISKLLLFTDFRGVYAAMAALVAVSFFLYHFLHGRHHH
ncbi:MAG: MFS transporter [Anaerovoracaceae bacterium]